MWKGVYGGRGQEEEEQERLVGYMWYESRRRDHLWGGGREAREGRGINRELIRPVHTHTPP